MKFKVDENLPSDAAALPRQRGFEADTVRDEGLGGAEDPVIADVVRHEKRVLLTLDRDFSDIRTYPPEVYSGIVVLRPKVQEKRAVLGLLQRLILVLANRSPEGELWTLESDRIRYRRG